jgi:hypothetical protein
MENCDKTGTHFDHCHDTGDTRGMLCLNHNTGLGMFHDSLNELQAAARYLVKSRLKVAV